jgi:hypothetical protein
MQKNHEDTNGVTYLSGRFHLGKSSNAGHFDLLGGNNLGFPELKSVNKFVIGVLATIQEKSALVLVRI